MVNFFQSRLQCKYARAVFLLLLCLCKCGIICCYIGEKCFTEHDNGYVYITKQRYVKRGNFILSKTLVEHPLSGASKNETRRSNDIISDRSEAK